MKIAIVGTGRMGNEISKLIDEDSTLEKVELLSDLFSNEDLKFSEIPDCILDASHPDNLSKIIKFATEYNTKCVIATTNFTEEQIKDIQQLATKVPVLRSTNFSIGVAVLNKLAEIATPLLKEDFDIEIIEKHHNKKIDSPSGTAKTLFNTINKEEEFNPVYSREGVCKRDNNDVGILSLRGGSLFGEHSVFYCGENEVIEVKHTAYSRSIFASGMLKSAKWLEDKPNGLYSINDLLFKEEN